VCCRRHPLVIETVSINRALEDEGRTIAFDRTGETYARLMAAADRAGKPEAARALAARGLKELPKAEQAPILAAQGSDKP
jgi:hypothetical protein